LKLQEHETRTDFEYRDINDVKKLLLPHRNLNLMIISKRLKNYIIATKKSLCQTDASVRQRKWCCYAWQLDKERMYW